MTVSAETVDVRQACRSKSSTLSITAQRRWVSVSDQTTYVQVAVAGSKKPRTFGADMANSFAKD